jgi:dTDP-4-amino-4,6-dideoxygalactose transaminase
VIPFVDLRAQYQSIKAEVDEAIHRVLDSCQFTLGPEVEAFENEFAAFCGRRYGIGVNTGTSALHLSLLAAGIGPGDEVITSPFTFVATVAAIHYAGARAVFVDIDPEVYTLDPAKLEAAITPRTRAIIPVHLYGQTADMAPILEIARRHGLTVVEDACQAHGAEYRGRRAGAMGEMGCFSFYPGKNLGAYGEGGMVVTDDPDLARSLRMYRDWGAETKYHHVLKGYNYRLEAIQAAVLRVKLRRLEAWTEARREAARRYAELLAGGPVAPPAERADRRHVYHVYAICSPARAQLQAGLAARGVQTGIHYPFPVHLLPAYADLGYLAGAFPHAELAAAQELSLPMYPELSSDAQAQVVEALHAVVADLDGGQASPIAVPQGA